MKSIEPSQNLPQNKPKTENLPQKISSTILHFFFPYIFRRRRHIADWFRIAKNGTITGAADNDPSGIVTYSQAGATLGFALLWLMALCIPLLIAVEEMSARVGVVTKKSLAKLIDLKFGRKIALLIAIIVAVANIATIGADIAGMSEILSVFGGIHWVWFEILLILVLSLLLIKGSYSFVSRFLFLLTPIFLAYIISGFLAKPNWAEAIQHTINPFSTTNPSYWLLAVALLGTTISPYLIFWQNTEEIEEKKRVKDLDEESLGVKMGMIYCNLVFYFIIITTAAVLFKKGIIIETAKDAALALKPLAGGGAFWLYSLGILGAGFLAIPILASSTAYLFSDIFHWPGGLNKKVWESKGFYLVLVLSLFLAIFWLLIGVSPVKMLIYSQVLAGLSMPLLIYFLIKIATNSELMGKYINKTWMTFFGWLAFLVILGFDIALIWQWIF